MPVDSFIVGLAVILAAAKLFGEIAERCGQPAVLGELVGGMLIGRPLLSLVSMHIPTIRGWGIDDQSPALAAAANIGVILLMFEIGLETDLDSLLRLGYPSLWVAGVGVVLPFIGGYFLMRTFGVPVAPAILTGAAMTATSVAITARAFGDLGRAGTPEADIVMGAAVADDVIGLVILAAVTGMAQTHTIRAASLLRASIAAVAYLGIASWIGLRFAPALLRLAARMRTRAALSTAALLLCFVLAVLAQRLAGLSPMVGAFAAGLVLAKTEHRVHFEHRLKPVADVFVPVFFVLVGAAMPLDKLNLASHAGHTLLLQAGALLLVAVAGKVLAGLSVPLRGANRVAIGIAMIPRGEVALIFAGYGLHSALFSPSLYTLVLLVVMASTLMTPPLLKIALRRQPASAPAPSAAGAVS